MPMSDMQLLKVACSAQMLDVSLFASPLGFVLWPRGIQICIAYFYYSLFHNYLRETFIKLLGISFNKSTAEYRDFPPRYYCN